MRAPAVPLINIDPYFNVWSPADKLTDTATTHWTSKPNTINGIVTVDGTAYRFMGEGNAPAMKQTDVKITALSTEYVFEGAGIRLTARFTSPILPDDLYLLTRPVSYLKVNFCSTDGAKHAVDVRIEASEELCLNTAGQDEVVLDELALADGIKAMKMGSKSQPVLEKRGDDIRIDWGYFYLTAQGDRAKVGTCTGKRKTADGEADMTFVYAENHVCHCTGALFAFAYDDIRSMVYFGEQLTSYWNRDGQKIEDEIAKAYADYDTVIARCNAFDDRMFIDAVRAGGEKYAELLELTFRQTVAAHKCVLDTDGNVLFISKECFSNGCAATVDVSYPSIPVYLIYNPELVRGMMRPIFKYSRSKEWAEDLKFDFAPHDAGQYPHVNGQVYGDNKYEYQMPVEECGNMLVMAAAVSIADKNADFAAENLDLLETWVNYLLENGRDPGNQLCTDDFAGHLAHNCNLSLKAIMGIAGLGIIYRMLGREADADKYIALAKDMAFDWEKRASNGDGSYRLTFDKEGGFSMKYNIVWDKLFGTEIMPKYVLESEFASYRRKMDKYGLALDSRKQYTKSDWLVWTATLAQNKDDFAEFVAPLWDAYNCSESRVPATDWYWTVTAKQVGFQNRTVQGGLWIKLLEYYGKMKV